jgi:glutamyl-tRNA synthetase
MKVRTRFAPSPTGYLHIGGVRTALFSWLYAKKHKGEFVLRIEDTDRERSTRESVDAILEGMQWLDMDYDEGPFYQTHRMDRYQEIIQQLLDTGHAYYCDCSRERLDQVREQQQKAKQKPRYDGHCRNRTDVDTSQPHVVRFRNPDAGQVEFEDLVKGKIRIANTELDDLIILRSDGSPTYNLTVVVDDYDMEISHVIRGDDHINNTPRQINILKALDAHIPRYAHLPMILGSDGKRMSKRHGAVSVTEYRDNGFLPRALLNYLVRLGWSHGDQEIFSIEEMIKLFTLNEVNSSPSTFNPDKLLWVNQQYLAAMELEDLTEMARDYMSLQGIDTDTGPNLARVVELQRERAKTLTELSSLCEFYYQNYTEFTDEKAAKKNLKPETLPVLEALANEFSTIDWHSDSIHAAMEKVVESMDVKFGKVGMPLRLAVTGGKPASSIDEVCFLVGREKVLERIHFARDYIYNS